jgi:hypothetical protein
VETSKHLAIYLNDHLAGSTMAVELAGRAASENEATELGEFLARLRGEIMADRETLKEIMRTLGVREDPLKQALGWLAEKAGRLKLNGELLGYSPLSPLVEFESLMLGVHGKRLLWRALIEVLGDDPRVELIRLEELLARANLQLEELEAHRIAVARSALRE